MDDSLRTALRNFTKMHDDYLMEWDRAMRTGDTSALERMMPNDYYVTFFSGNEDRPATFDRTEAVEGMRQSVSAHSGMIKRFENRIIRLRNDENAVVFYEQVLEKDGEEQARLFTIENWQHNDNQWKMSREVQEHIK